MFNAEIINQPSCVGKNVEIFEFLSNFQVFDSVRVLD